ncbi:hypothetical protein DEU56DRAFT_984614 [Suillus clintonianus]|uniref:uncharacterized protein n=1 Tax=Suillus clintonianus TaxID=1904413 RepID=UPI001B8635B6|nr:uncharacterized protein DEU56DRAFT_984614 [Suillus clintonianus]KAG2119294.1 hypothetical protein DEU56DRAFT_984614 [Suillus clintonianus]
MPQLPSSQPLMLYRVALQQPQDDVAKCRAALQSHPPGYDQHLTSLVNLNNSLADRFERRGALSDLDGAIEHHGAALLLHPLRGILFDLDEAIEHYRAALLRYPLGHSLRSSTLNNLSDSLRAKSNQRGIPSDLDTAIELHQAALLHRPYGHPDRSKSQQSYPTLTTLVRGKQQVSGDASAQHLVIIGQGNPKVAL